MGLLHGGRSEKGSTANAYPSREGKAGEAITALEAAVNDLREIVGLVEREVWKNELRKKLCNPPQPW